MTTNDRRALIAFIVVALATAAILALSMTDARADQIEPATSDVVKVQVTYAEPMPHKASQNRHYFETNDGAAYRYVNYKRCALDNAVPNRVCRTVFWYAR